MLYLLPYLHKKLQEMNNLTLLQWNVRSFRAQHPYLLRAIEELEPNIICLQETWLEEDDDCTEYDLFSYSTHLNNYGRGKGIMIFFKKNIFTHISDVKEQ